MSDPLSRRAVLGGAALVALSACEKPQRAAAPPAAASPSAPPPSAAPVALRSRLGELERAYRGRIGVFAVDTGTGRTLGHRERERFPLLSTFKVLAAAAVLRRGRDSDPGLLERTVRWTAGDLVDHSPVTRERVDAGLTVAELCRAAITVSDNTAANLLLDRIGGPAGLTRYLRGLGDPFTRLDRRETALNDWVPGEQRDTTTPAAMGRDLEALVAGRALHPQDRELLTGWMRDTTTGAGRIRAGLPADWTVGGKTGSGGAYGPANDVAVAQPPAGAPIVLAIHTTRTARDARYDESVIARTAAIVREALGR
jgi:beta-lactamase class A